MAPYHVFLLAAGLCVIGAARWRSLDFLSGGLVFAALAIVTTHV